VRGEFHPNAATRKGKKVLAADDAEGRGYDEKKGNDRKMVDRKIALNADVCNYAIAK